MKAVLSRVSSARVVVDEETIASISHGVLALIGVGTEDSPDSWETMARKIAELRIFEDEKSALDVNAPVLLVSQFTLMGRTAKGRRPSWSDAADGASAEPIMKKTADSLRARGLTVEEGKFGAYMHVHSVNDGPFTVLVET